MSAGKVRGGLLYTPALRGRYIKVPRLRRPKIGRCRLTKCAVWCTSRQQWEAEKEKDHRSDTISLTHYMYSVTVSYFLTQCRKPTRPCRRRVLLNYSGHTMRCIKRTGQWLTALFVAVHWFVHTFFKSSLIFWVISDTYGGLREGNSFSFFVVQLCQPFEWQLIYFHSLLLHLLQQSFGWF